MAEVKWIKLTVDMFDNRKIKHLRRLPDGNNIVLIWVMLLTMAGRCNSSGMIFLTENIPYTPKMLADELGFEESTVILALNALEQFNMVVKDDQYFSIAGWEEYQNIEGMEKLREQTRQRVAKCREKKALDQCNATCNVTVTLRNATDKEKDKEKDQEKDNICATSRKRYARAPFVPPTLDEVKAYCRERGNDVDPKRFYDYFTESQWVDGKGAKVLNWKQKVITWERNSCNKKSVGANGIQIEHTSSDLDELF